MVAGVPMMNGASTLEGFVPDVDATIVTRILDAGGKILGKQLANISAYQAVVIPSPAPVVNPRKEGYSAGGSSSGSAALLAHNEVDLAIGGDQAGRLDTSCLLRCLWLETDTWFSSIYSHNADRTFNRPYGTNEQECRR